MDIRVAGPAGVDRLEARGRDNGNCQGARHGIKATLYVSVSVLSSKELTRAVKGPRVDWAPKRKDENEKETKERGLSPAPIKDGEKRRNELN